MYVCMYVAMSFLLKQLIPQDNHIAKHYATLCHPTPYMHEKLEVNQGVCCNVEMV